MKKKINLAKHHNEVAKKKVHFEVYKGIFGSYNHHLRVTTLKTMSKYVKNKSPMKLLDMGCGDGYSIIKVNKKFKCLPDQYIGLDISTIRLKRASKTGMNFVCANGDLLPFKSKSIDYVLLNEVIEHTPNPKKMLSEIHRVLKNGGLFFVDFPNELNSEIIKLFMLHFPIRHPGHLSDITPKKIKKWTGKRFKLLHKQTFPFNHMPFFLCVNYFMILKKRK